jgi:large subunit ribosomal protein L22
MSEITAQLNDYRQAPRKVRVVAGLVRGKSVKDALVSLEFLPKRAADPISKLIRSAVANARSQNIETENLILKELRVDGGKILYRRRSASRGRAPAIRKRTSHILVVLSEDTKKKLKKQNAKSKSNSDVSAKK